MKNVQVNTVQFAEILSFLCSGVHGTAGREREPGGSAGVDRRCDREARSAAPGRCDPGGEQRERDVTGRAAVRGDQGQGECDTEDSSESGHRGWTQDTSGILIT